MKNKIFTLLLSTFMIAFSAYAQKGVTNVEKTPLAPSTMQVSEKAQWDVLFAFDGVEAASPGMETNGTYFYTTTWNAGNFHRYNMDGTNGTTFTIAGISNLRDMAYDGQYFYGSDATMTIQIMDLDNETSVGTITVDGASGVTGVRHIAYDPTLDGGNGGFWVGNWAELAAIDMSGGSLVANSETPTISSGYGSAYDNWTDPSNPKLWLFTQPGTTSNAVFVEFDINTLTLTGTVHDALDVTGAATDALAGGACTYEANGLFILAGSLQQDPNKIFGYELTVTADPAAPAAPTALTVTPDAGGALTADLAWTNPDTDVSGAALTELTEMVVWVDGDSTYTVTTPTIGGAETYTATVTTAGMHDFVVVGYNSNGKGIVVAESAWVGEDIPAAAGNILLSVTDMDATVTWDAPTEGANGAYFSGTGLTYDVIRQPEGLLVSDDQTALTFTETITAAGNYFYEVIPSNATGEGVSGVSNTEIIGDVLVYDFEAGMPDGFNLIDGDCGWMTGTDGSSSFFTIPAHTTYAYVNDDACNADMSDVWMITPFIDFTGVTAPFMQFESFSQSDIFTIKASTDGTNWTDVQTITPDPAAWKTENIDLSAFAEEPAVLIAFHYNDDGAWGYGWGVDDILINGVLAPLNTVTFTVDDGTDPLADVAISVAGQTLATDASGIATIGLPDGDYDWATSLTGYEDQTGTVTVSGAAVPVDISLVVALAEPTVGAPVPTQDEANVISLFSDTYTDVTVDTWRTDWSSAILEEVTIDGNPAKKYSDLDFVGIETGTSTVDATAMTYLHLDIWSPNFTQFSIKLVDYGADGAYAGGDDTEHQIDSAGLATEEWISLDIPLSDFTGLAAREHLAQYILVGQPTGSTVLYIDNFFFYNLPATTYTVTFNVDMNAAIDDGSFVVGTDTVSVTGSMAGWAEPGTNDALFMEDADADGIYTLVMDLEDASYEYKYFLGAGWNGGEWEGGDNRTFTVAGADVTLDDVWGVVGINDAAQVSFNVYPNPTSGLVNIKTQGSANITVMDIVGHVVMSTQINGQTTIDLSNNANGIYFINLTSGNKVGTKRIIVE